MTMKFRSLDLIKCLLGFILVKKGVWLNNIVDKSTYYGILKGILRYVEFLFSFSTEYTFIFFGNVILCH